jgi:hypothetical protein
MKNYFLIFDNEVTGTTAKMMRVKFQTHHQAEIKATERQSEHRKKEIPRAILQYLRK